MGRRPDLTVVYAREAIDMTATLAPSDGVKGLVARCIRIWETRSAPSVTTPAPAKPTKRR